jgi:hypothetical protein
MYRRRVHLNTLFAPADLQSTIGQRVPDSQKEIKTLRLIHVAAGKLKKLRCEAAPNVVL